MENWPITWLIPFMRTSEARIRREAATEAALMHVTLQSSVWGGTASTLFQTEVKRLIDG